MTACRAGLLAAVLVVFLPSLATASPVDGHGGTSPVPVAGGLRFEPAAGAEQWRLTVSGPGGYYVRRPISGSGLTLSLAGEDGVLPLDGSYLWELQALAGNRPVVGETRSGAFRVRSGEILLPDAAQVEPGVTEAYARPGVPTPQAPDHVGPFYVDGHLAFGEEIDGTEIITFLSMLVEEDNIRLLFRDTSTSSNFPTNDWQAKEGFVAVDATAALARVAELPLLEWSYLGAPGVRHLGPTAEAFHAAFLLGRDERSINPLDLAGVALAAIQGLRSRVVDLTRREEATLSLLRDQERQISSLESDRDLMRRRIESLEQMARGLAAGAAGKPMAAQP